MRTIFLVVFILVTVLATKAQARCSATVNGAPMTAEECEVARNIYGAYPYGHYLRDGQGNWVNIYNWSEKGNVFLDAQRPASNRPSNNGGGSKWFSPQDWDWDPPNRR